MGDLKSLIAEISLEESAKVFGCRSAACSPLAASLADCSSIYVFILYCVFLLSFHTKLHECDPSAPCGYDVGRPMHPYPDLAAGVKISYLFTGLDGVRRMLRVGFLPSNIGGGCQSLNLEA